MIFDMHKLTREDLFTLEAYATERTSFREQVLAHKQNRRLAIGEHALLYFEDRLTVRYQVQEMLRIERIFEASGIDEELDAYNPLIPDGQNLKATFMIQYVDVEVRRQALAALRGVEDKVWLQVSGHDPIYAIADEDLDRSNEEKTSAVHFLRFELGKAGAHALRGGAALAAGIAHEAYNSQIACVDATVRDALAADLDS
jgi:hypothetical protein